MIRNGIAAGSAGATRDPAVRFVGLAQVRNASAWETVPLARFESLAGGKRMVKIGYTSVTASSYVLSRRVTFVVLSELSSWVIKDKFDDGSAKAAELELVLNVHVLSVVEFGPVIAMGDQLLPG